LIIESSTYTPEQIEALKPLADACADPVWFAENVLHEKVWSKQKEMLRSIANNDKVAVRSGHKTSKTRSMAILALWWVFYWHLRGEDARTAISSASFDQVKKALWREIVAMYRRSPEYQKLCPKPPSLDPSTGLTLVCGNQVFGFSTTEPERAAGVSSPHILYLLDEASGIEDNIFEAMEGNMAGGAKMFMASQATKMVGEFYNAFNKYARYWHTIRLSSADSPNVTGEMKIPGLATKDWIDQKRDMWGVDSIAYRVRVLGEFPGASEDSVIDADSVARSIDAWASTSQIGTLELGVDVARFGDDESVIQPVRGQYAHLPTILTNRDGVYVARKIIEVVRNLRRETDGKIRVKIDVVGLGSSPVDHLQSLDTARELGILVVPVHVQSNAHDNDNYHDAGSEMAFSLAKWIRDGGAMPNDDILKEELLSNVYTLDAKGRRTVMNKKDVKKLIGRSPDRRNALEMAVYNPQSQRSRGSAHVDF
jgi:phage terminase large subunit